MITGHTTRLSNLFVWAVVLVLAVFAATALIAFDQSGWRAKPQAEQPLTVANPFPYHRLHELTAYKHSEWGLELANQWVAAPWFDISQLPAGYVRSEKGLPPSRPQPRDLYTDLMAVK